MCESFAAENLAIPASENDWQSWAAGLKTLDNFSNEGIPGPYIFDTWQDWAVAVLNAVNTTAN
jgi:hypothetical protein